MKYLRIRGIHPESILAKYMHRCKILIVTFLSVIFADPDSRSFLMGFTPWPYEATLEGVDWVYDTINQYGDIVSHHLEEGVPWPEAYAGEEYSQSFQNELQNRKDRLVDEKKIVLSLNPLNISRNGLALYRGEDESMPLPSPWDTCEINSMEVKTAFCNYASGMIDFFNPEYILLGIEVNLLIRNNPQLWPKYVDLHKHLYTEVKKKHPTLQVSVSVFSGCYFPQWSGEDTLELQMNALEDIIDYVDFLSFSVHPFISALLADSFPDDYIKNLFAVVEKPVAISESSYPAQVWQTITPPVLTFNGSEEKQENVLNQMFTESHSRNAKFVIWWTVRDFDTLWVNTLNSDEVALPWRDTGIFGENGEKRAAFTAWKSWYDKKYTNKIQHTDLTKGKQQGFLVQMNNSGIVLLFKKKFKTIALKVYSVSGKLVYSLNKHNTEKISVGRDFLGSDNVYILNVKGDGNQIRVKTFLVK